MKPIVQVLHLRISSWSHALARVAKPYPEDLPRHCAEPLRRSNPSRGARGFGLRRRVGPRNDDVAASRPFRNAVRRMICPTISTSLRAQRSNPSRREKKEWIASSQVLLAMTMWRGGALRDRNVTARQANHLPHAKTCPVPAQKIFLFFRNQNQL
jgi:hypothetical protein